MKRRTLLQWIAATPFAGLVKGKALPPTEAREAFERRKARIADIKPTSAPKKREMAGNGDKAIAISLYGHGVITGNIIKNHGGGIQLRALRFEKHGRIENECEVGKK